MLSTERERKELSYHTYGTSALRPHTIHISRLKSVKSVVLVHDTNESGRTVPHHKSSSSSPFCTCELGDCVQSSRSDDRSGVRSPRVVSGRPRAAGCASPVPRRGIQGPIYEQEVYQASTNAPLYTFTCCAKKVAAVSASKSHARKPSTSSACEWVHLYLSRPSSLLHALSLFLVCLPLRAEPLLLTYSFIYLLYFISAACCCSTSWRCSSSRSGGSSSLPSLRASEICRGYYYNTRRVGK